MDIMISVLMIWEITHQHTHDELHKHRKEHYDDHAGIHSREMWEDMI